ncbi:MAG TPA: PilZ domain-containing protein [Spirochaetales bacterium]|nr:PilZ domain-containing protein [Spirochaetales bacterium]HRZ64883.1 PilZ domain-containing protein [Spirochaetia bacterium]
MDRRREERYELDVPIRIKLGDKKAPAAIEASSRDISTAGVFINLSGAQLEAQQSVHLELTLTIGKLQELFGCSSMVTLEVDGSVARVLQDGVFVRFGNRYSILPHDVAPGDFKNPSTAPSGGR